MKTLFAGGLGDLRGNTVLDFGCGIGRLSKALLEQYDCRVLGVDISPDMRRMAAEYVNSDRFSVISYEMFCALAERGGLKADCAIAVYVLQHVFDPAHAIKLLSRAVADKLLVLDAVDFGLEPGELVLRDNVPASLTATTIGPHPNSFSEVMGLAALRGTAPQHCALIGVQPAAMTLAAPLSTTVSERFEAAQSMALDLLRQWGIAPQLRAQPRQLSAEEIDSVVQGCMGGAQKQQDRGLAQARNKRLARRPCKGRALTSL